MQKLADVRSRMSSVAGIGDGVPHAGDGRLGEALADARASARVRASTPRAARDARAPAGAARADGRGPGDASPLWRTRPQVSAHRCSSSSARTAACAAATTRASAAQRRAFVRAARRGRRRSRRSCKGRRAETYLRRATDVAIAEASGLDARGRDRRRGRRAARRRSRRRSSAARPTRCGRATRAFLSTVRREPRSCGCCRSMPPRRRAPARAAPIAPREWFYEPAQRPCVERAARAFVRLQVEDVLLEAFASEQAARMVTMQEATERADQSLPSCGSATTGCAASRSPPTCRRARSRRRVRRRGRPRMSSVTHDARPALESALDESRRRRAAARPPRRSSARRATASSSR